jgi:AraC-like DNA-binding protein
MSKPVADKGAYGDRLGSSFGLDRPPAITTSTPQLSTLAITEIRIDAIHGGILTTPIPRENAFLFGLQLLPVTHHELWLDGKVVPVQTFRAGSTSIYDLKRNPIAYVNCAAHTLFFYVSHQALNEMADEMGTSHCTDLQYIPGVSYDDTTLYHLGCSLRSTLDRPEPISTLFADQILLSLHTHCAGTYGGLRDRALPPHTLAPWQLEYAKELLNANLDGEISLAEIAQACDLSAAQFARAFRQTTGRTPHQWLMARRIDMAKNFLIKTSLPLATIAVNCGFVDRDHFARVFARLTGITPGRWRNNRRA